MSSDVIISVEKISKKYKLGEIGAGSLREAAERMWHRVRGRDPEEEMGEVGAGRRTTVTKLQSSKVTESFPVTPVTPETCNSSSDLWALRDISFEVNRGEVLGIIGRNGAGKSTLLKILSRITEPTSGRAVMRGRVGSLLEVGTGFHPELTGRENIFLNGAILGMRKKEIENKFDEIVAFSEVERFIDTPVKRYSSGMYVRLAFAVAAHLDPEILLVDEVLAVGDAQFQKKCLGKMGEVAHQGRTVLFVSHNMGMINSLCGSAVLLDSGSVALCGSVSKAISLYYSGTLQSSFHVDYRRSPKPVGDEFATLLEAYIENSAGEKTGDMDIRSGFTVTMIYRLDKQTGGPAYPNFHVYNSQGVHVFVTGAGKTTDMAAGIFSATCSIPGNFLNNDTYSIGLAVTFTHSGVHVSFFEQNALSVTVRDPMEETLDEERNGYAGVVPGTIRPKLDWKVKRLT